MVTALAHPASEVPPVPVLSRQPEAMVRAARSEDVDVLGALWFYQRCHHTQWDRLYETTKSGQQKWQEDIKVCLNQMNHCVLVAEDRLGRILGYVHGSFYPWPMSPHEYYGSINTIAISPEAQGQGVGTKLVQQLLNWFKAQNIQYISVHVDYRNRSALRLYEKMGFRAYQQRLMMDLGL